MKIGEALLDEAIDAVSSVDGIAMAPEALVEDIMLMARVWPVEADFKAAIVSTVRAMKLVRDKRVTADPLSRAYDGWYSYHYQLSRQQGTKANMRLVYRFTEDGIEVKGFGHRFRPIDLYYRIMHDAIAR